MKKKTEKKTKFLKTSDLASLAKVPVQTIQRLMRRGVLPGRRLPGSRDQWRFPMTRLAEIVDVLVAAGLVGDDDAPRIIEQATTKWADALPTKSKKK